MNDWKESTDSRDIPSLESPYWRKFVFIAIGLSVIALYPLSRIEYLLFHNIVELSSIAISITLFSIGWNSRLLTRNDAYTLLAIAYLVIAGLDLMHTLSYKGMGVFPSAGVDPPTQFWIAARSMEAISYLLAGYLFGKTGRIKPWRTLVLYGVAGTLLTLCIWPWQIFPVCMDKTTGLTEFKVAAEYLICLLLMASGLIFWKIRHKFNPQLLKLLLLSIGFKILSEISFTLYQDVYGISNAAGHLFKLVSVLMVYRVLVIGSLRTPYQSIFRELTESHVALDNELIHRRNTEKQLRIANQELEAFVHTASHDLRLPLTVITGSAEFLQSELSSQIKSNQLDLLGNIEKQGHRMSTLLNDLLELAQVGTLKQSTQIVDPAKIATQVIESLSKEIMTHGCRLKVEEMPNLSAHPSLIYQLLANLIANAVRYGCNPEKPIVIGAELRDDLYRLFVRDHGPGIPGAEREQIFNVFYRISGQKLQGTGIGLAIVKKIALHYSGRAFVEETPGGGATFWVEFENANVSLEDPVQAYAL